MPMHPQLNQVCHHHIWQSRPHTEVELSSLTWTLRSHPLAKNRGIERAGTGIKPLQVQPFGIHSPGSDYARVRFTSFTVDSLEHSLVVPYSLALHNALGAPVERKAPPKDQTKASQKLAPVELMELMYTDRYFAIPQSVCSYLSAQFKLSASERLVVERLLSLVAQRHRKADDDSPLAGNIVPKAPPKTMSVYASLSFLSELTGQNKGAVAKAVKRLESKKIIAKSAPTKRGSKITLLLDRNAIFSAVKLRFQRPRVSVDDTSTGATDSCNHPGHQGRNSAPQGSHSLAKSSCEHAKQQPSGMHDGSEHSFATSGIAAMPAQKKASQSAAEILQHAKKLEQKLAEIEQQISDMQAKITALSGKVKLSPGAILHGLKPTKDQLEIEQKLLDFSNAIKPMLKQKEAVKLALLQANQRAAVLNSGQDLDGLRSETDGKCHQSAATGGGNSSAAIADDGASRTNVSGAKGAQRSGATRGSNARKGSPVRYLKHSQIKALFTRIKELKHLSNPIETLEYSLYSLCFGWHAERSEMSNFHAMNHLLNLVKTNCFTPPSGFDKSRVSGLVKLAAN